MEERLGWFKVVEVPVLVGASIDAIWWAVAVMTGAIWVGRDFGGEVLFDTYSDGVCGSVVAMEAFQHLKRSTGFCRQSRALGTHS